MVKTEQTESKWLFLDPSENGTCKANLHPTIWTDRRIHKVTVKICLSGAECTGVIHWQEHWKVIFMNCWRLILYYHENGKVLGNMLVRVYSHFHKFSLQEHYQVLTTNRQKRSPGRFCRWERKNHPCDYTRAFSSPGWKSFTQLLFHRGNGMSSTSAPPLAFLLHLWGQDI